EQYQAEDAWTWEHQALVRARAVAGDPDLCQRVESLRRTLLGRARDPDELAREVVRMRRRMREHAGVKPHAAEMDVKQGFGGIVDIEFMVQYAVLAWAHREPALADWSDNVRILDTLARSGLLPESRCRALNDAYLDLRSATHRLALQQKAAKVQPESVQEHRQAVLDAWSSFFGDTERELTASPDEPS
ncbi:MAG: bifunctional glutamine synthetase adenylyltransferase/deadenyltransferase, partial [Pseudomonadota bacterium]